MLKRFVSALLVFILLFSYQIGYAESTYNFETVYIPYETDYNSRAVVKARYADTKEIIPLSTTYMDRLYAMVPLENANREIEAFETEEAVFTDYDPKHYEYHTFEVLSRTGIIKGDEQGRALPFENVTRAEAVAMFIRMLGIKTDNNYKFMLGFDDVKREDWYYEVISTATRLGLVIGDSKTAFSPDRNVTREEIMVMANRVVEYASFGFPGSNNLNATDTDKISSWAKDAYEKLGNYAATDYENEHTENPTRVINPQKNATRFDVANMIFDLIERCSIYPSIAATEYGFDKEMPKIDGSTSTYPFTEAVYQTLFYNGLNHPSKPQKHSKSHASYERLINGEIDMMFASVYPANDILVLAEEKGVELELIPIAYDAMIFFTNADNPIEGLTSEQISNIYVNNEYENWNQIGGTDAILYPYCRNNDSGSHAQMEKHFLKGNEIHETIRKETTSVTMSNVLTDVMNAKTEDPKGFGLGYSIYYYFNNMDLFYNTKTELKLLAIDGIHPSDETIADGTYPLSNNTYVVLRKDTAIDSPARKMAEFMLTEAGQYCVELSGFGKLK